MAMAVRSSYSFIGVILLAGLSILSWISTYTGIMELISASTAETGLFVQIAIAFAVFMLQLMILYVLDAMFSGELRWWIWPLYVLGYILLFMVSVGFAFGFYWKYLEAGSVTTQAAEASVVRVQQELQLGQNRLSQLQSTFNTLSLISANKAVTERTAGGTCPGSGPGDGPRRRLRDADAERFKFANDFIASRTAAVNADIAAHNTDLERILQKDPSTVDASGSRNAFIGDLNRRLGLTVTRFNDLQTEPQLQQLKDELKIRAEQTRFPDDRGGTFVCPDIQLQSALNGVVRAIDELPVLDKPQLRAYEGSEAVIEAFRRLTNSGIGWLKQGAAAVTGQPVPEIEGGMAERDYIPLLIAVFVDICILLISINRPFGFMFEMTQSMQRARQSQANEFLIPFFEVFQGVFDKRNPPTPKQQIDPLLDITFDHNGRYYAAVPLDFRDDDHEERKRQILRRLNTEDDTTWFSPVSDMPLETSRYISSVFLVLAGRGVARLLAEPWPDGLVTTSVRDKLKQQGSVYAQADAFRLYVLDDKAWPQFVQSIVGSGAEAEERTFKRRGASQQQSSGFLSNPLGALRRSPPALESPPQLQQVTAEERPQITAQPLAGDEAAKVNDQRYSGPLAGDRKPH